jgi:glycerophosphoryl diester phosphodiesterase family protein
LIRTKHIGYALVAAIAVTTLGCVGFHFRSILKGNLLAAWDLSIYNRRASAPSAPVSYRMVAHAGGAVHGRTYTNSREALDQSYARGFRVFELDFHWTSDDRLVLIHDWNDIGKTFNTHAKVMSYAEFVTSRRWDGLHQLTFEDLQSWLRLHTDAFIVTDTKDDNVRLLNYFYRNAPQIAPQLIVQIYRLSELQAARPLRPRAIWLTMYKNSYPSWALARIVSVDAFVIPVSQYKRYEDTALMERMNYYVHSVKASDVEPTYRNLPGIYGVYVD